MYNLNCLTNLCKTMSKFKIDKDKIKLGVDNVALFTGTFLCLLYVNSISNFTARGNLKFI